MKKISFIAVFILCAPFVVCAQGGKVFETRTLKSDILKMERRYAVYLPAGYDESDRSYPVLYLLHGAGDDHTGWVQFGQVQNIADRVIAEGLAGPMIIVMPDAQTGALGYFNSIRGNFNYEDFFFKEFIPHIEKTYRVRSGRRYRAVAGLSMGGLGSIFYALYHPDVFAAAAPLSAATGNGFRHKMNMENALAGISKKQIEEYFDRYNLESTLKNVSVNDLKKIKSIRWYISCGDDDFLYEDNSMMHIIFRKNEIPHEFRIKDGGHTWTYWRMELPFVLEFVAKSFMQH